MSLQISVKFFSINLQEKPFSWLRVDICGKRTNKHGEGALLLILVENTPKPHNKGNIIHFLDPTPNANTKVFSLRTPFSVSKGTEIFVGRVSVNKCDWISFCQLFKIPREICVGILRGKIPSYVNNAFH
jgi:hypothetical protein